MYLFRFIVSGYIRGAGLEMTSMEGHKPLFIEFSPSFENGTIMAIAWDNAAVTFVTHRFLTSEPFM